MLTTCLLIQEELMKSRLYSIPAMLCCACCVYASCVVNAVLCMLGCACCVNCAVPAVLCCALDSYVVHGI